MAKGERGRRGEDGAAVRRSRGGGLPPERDREVVPELPPEVEERLLELVRRVHARVYGIGLGWSEEEEAQEVPEDEDPGLACVRGLFEAFQVDEEWSLWEGRGFRWWPHRLEQRVWAGRARREPELGLTVARVHAETEVVRDVGIPVRMAQFASSALVPDASMNALLVGGSIRFRAAVVVHGENLGWVGRLLQLAALAQACDAETVAETWARGFRGEPAFSAHPARGPRPAPDEMLGALDELPGKDAPSAWAEGSELAEVAGELEDHGLRVSLGPGGLEVDLPGAPGSPRVHRLRVTTAPHAGLGGGVRLRLHLAGWPRNLAGGDLFPAELNALEDAHDPGCHLVGSWAAELDPEAKPYFNCFVPNVLYRPGALLNLVLSMGIRARWADALIGPE